MDNKTHKTLRVRATMHSELYADINVPIGTDEDAIWQFIRDNGVDGGDLMEHDGFLDGGWTWEEPIYDCEFDPKAWDFSEEIKNHELTRYSH